MKNICKLLLILLPIIGSAQQKNDLGWLFFSDSNIRLDHQQHIVASAAISMPVYLMYETNTNNTEAQAIIYTFATVQGLGLIKECSISSTDSRDIRYIKVYL